MIKYQSPQDGHSGVDGWYTGLDENARVEHGRKYRAVELV